MSYKFTIFDDKIEEVQTLFTDSAAFDGTVVGFISDGEVELVYNLPPGYSILKEEEVD